MSRPLVSAVIVFRDAARYLDEAIVSVMAQSYRPLELVLVDDGSSDGSIDIAAGYADRATLVRQAPSGVGPARNAGVAAARGAAIAFCDADDLWEPGKIARQMAVLDGDPDAAVVLTMVEEFLSPDVAPDVAAAAPVPGPRVGAIPSALLARRSAMERVGPFDDSRLGQWTDWYARLTESGLGIRVVDEVLVRRRVHDANLGVAARDDRRQYLIALKASLDRRRSGS